ncbi:MAG: arsenite methyltransferase [Thermoanaerobaculia bacterium]
MSREDRVRRQVSKAYAEAVTIGDGCCGGGSERGGVLETGADKTPKGVAAKTAGYTEEEIASLPAEAAVNSFGCGNPTAFAGVSEGEVVVDLGSGAGIDLLLAAQKVGSSGKVIGIDMTDEMIERARKAIRSAGADNIEVRKGFIEELPVDDSSVDLVISNCVINLSPDKPRVFAEISRVLRPGGRMSVSDIVVEELPWWLRRIPSVYNSCVGGAISENRYVAGLEAAGLDEVEVLDRLVYEADQMTNLVLSEVPGRLKTFVKRFGLTWLVRIVAGRLEGKIWSARFAATKRAAAASAA